VGYSRLVKRCREILPKVKSWTVRSDSAGYQLEMLDQWALDGIIYYVTVDQREGMLSILKQHNTWTAYVSNGVITEQEVAEIAYVPSFSNQSELEIRRNTFRFIAIRKPKTGQLEINGDKYVYQVIVTNTKEEDLNKILKTHWQRCGSIEHVHEELKNGCGLKRFPSKHFNVNAAWCSLSILTYNVLRLIQNHVLRTDHHPLLQKSPAIRLV
jgi:hypothetical protein